MKFFFISKKVLNWALTIIIGIIFCLILFSIFK